MSSSEHRGVEKMSYPVKVACSVVSIPARCRSAAPKMGLHLG